MNAVSKLNEIVQKQFGESIVTEVTDVKPLKGEVWVKITLPNHVSLEGYGSNQKVAKQIVAQEILENYQEIVCR